MLLPHLLPHVGEACLLAGVLLSLLYGLWWGPGVIGGTPLLKMPKGQRLYQFWINFAGSAVGWIIVYAYLTRPSLGTVSFADLLLMLAGFIGIMGYLPALVIPNAVAMMNAAHAWLQGLRMRPASSGETLGGVR